MKTIHFIALLGILFSLTVGFSVAFGAPTGKLVVDPNGHPVQTFSPYPPASACTTATVTKGAIATVNVAGYSALSYDVRDSTNAAKVVKRHLGSNAAYLPSASGTIALNKDMTTVVFKPYSGVAAAYTVCTELQRGGATP